MGDLWELEKVKVEGVPTPKVEAKMGTHIIVADFLGNEVPKIDLGFVGVLPTELDREIVSDEEVKNLVAEKLIPPQNGGPPTLST